MSPAHQKALLTREIEDLDRRIEVAEDKASYPPSGCSYPEFWTDMQQTAVCELRHLRSVKQAALSALCGQLELLPWG